MVRSVDLIEKRWRERLRQVFRAETLAGLRVMIVAKGVVFLVLAAWFFYRTSNWPVRLYYEAVMVLLLVLPGVQYRLLRRGRFRSWSPYFFALLEVGILGYATLVPNPFFPVAFPPHLRLRVNSAVSFFVLVAASALSYSPGLVLWTGFLAAGVWAAGLWRVVSLPETLTRFSQVMHDHPGRQTFIGIYFDPHFVDVLALSGHILFLLLVTLTLALAVWRSRALVRRHAKAERSRATLARYFSPNVLDELEREGASLAEPRQHDVAVLFADIVDYSSHVRSLPPDRLMAFLREYHSRMEEAVFRFGGTLDKFIGDAVMASFGAPRPRPDRATDALRCAREMLASIGRWNQDREQTGEAPVRIGIGLHYGPAVMGDVGSVRSAAFAVVGETTNISSRLEAATRELGAAAVGSGAFIEAVRQESEEAEGLLDGFEDAGQRDIRGQGEPIHLWMLR